jgi:hypothetical protein
VVDQGLQTWMPPRPGDVPAISASQAIARARKMADAPGVTFRTLLVRATIPSTEPPKGTSFHWANVVDRLVWVVVARAPEPQKIPLGQQAPTPGESAAAVHYFVAQDDNFVLDANTGDMLNGFFTR